MGWRDERFTQFTMRKVHGKNMSQGCKLSFLRENLQERRLRVEAETITIQICIVTLSVRLRDNATKTCVRL
jgi:hypothetical protein